MTRLIAAFGLWVACALPALATVDIVEVDTPDGHAAWLVEDHSIPFVAMEIVFRGGTSLDPEGKRGAVDMMASLLSQGAGEMSAQEFAAARDDLAASISFDAGDDSVSLSMRFLTETTDAATALAATALADPAFSDAAIERVRGQTLSNLRSRTQDPDDIASDAFAARVYADGHPYATPGMGTRDSVTALTRADLVAAHDAAIARDRVVIAAAGDITAERLGAVIDAMMADLPETGAPLPQAADLTFGGGVEVVDFATPQTVVSFGQPGIARDADDFFPAFVANQILGGGGLGSRLMEEVREKRGLTYGVYSYLMNKDHADFLAGRTATANARAGETVEVIREEWRRMAEDGPTAQELEDAKTYLIGGYPLRFDGNASIARILAGMQLDGLSPDYVTTRNDRVRDVTLDEVRRVAGELFAPEALTFVLVGQPEGLPAGN